MKQIEAGFFEEQVVMNALVPNAKLQHKIGMINFKSSQAQGETAMTHIRRAIAETEQIPKGELEVFERIILDENGEIIRATFGYSPNTKKHVYQLIWLLNDINAMLMDPEKINDIPNSLDELAEIGIV